LLCLTTCGIVDASLDYMHPQLTRAFAEIAESYRGGEFSQEQGVGLETAARAMQ